MSACVWVYLGGRYRFLTDESRIGIHQFAFGNENGIQTGMATAITQEMAAEIVQFIKENRADTDFFKLVTSASPNEIFFVPHDELRELRVVTDHVYDESWSFEYMKGSPYLKIWQQSSYGENKLMLLCPKDKLLGEAFLQTPRAMPIDSIGIFVNHKLVTIPKSLIAIPPQVQENRLTISLFEIPPSLANQMVTASSIGAAMQPLNKDIFFGFDRDQKRKG